MKRIAFVLCAFLTVAMLSGCDVGGRYLDTPKDVHAVVRVERLVDGDFNPEVCFLVGSVDRITDVWGDYLMLRKPIYIAEWMSNLSAVAQEPAFSAQQIAVLSGLDSLRVQLSPGANYEVEIISAKAP